MEFQKFRVPSELKDELIAFYSHQSVFPLSNLEQYKAELSTLFGVYTLFYRGEFDLYSTISRANSVEFMKPIYVGKAVAKGARTAKVSKSNSLENHLFKR